jgi:hypothetical protein
VYGGTNTLAQFCHKLTCTTIETDKILSKHLSVSMPYGEHRLLSGFLKSNKETVQRF